MSDLTDLRDHARARANWTDDGPIRAACAHRTAFGSEKPPDHANCGGLRCRCECHRPSDEHRMAWARIADEIDAYLAIGDDDEGPDLFGGVA